MCNKRFITAGDLQSHERSHLDLKLYKCNICNKKFSTSSYLRRHEKSKTHNKQKTKFAPIELDKTKVSQLFQ